MPEEDLREDPQIEAVYKQIKFEALKAIVETIATTSSKLIISEFERALQNDHIIANVKNNLMPYLYTAGLLSFSGREITEKNMYDVLRSIGISPNPVLIRVVLNTGIKSHLVYLYCFYFLVANGMEASDENIVNVVRALGLQPDPERVVDILEFASLPSEK
jgi:ribosomal protein L12E/L44/L45/RPP1/RPP2